MPSVHKVSCGKPALAKSHPRNMYAHIIISYVWAVKTQDITRNMCSKAALGSKYNTHLRLSVSFQVGVEGRGFRVRAWASDRIGCHLSEALVVSELLHFIIICDYQELSIKTQKINAGLIIGESGRAVVQEYFEMLIEPAKLNLWMDCVVSEEVEREYMLSIVMALCDTWRRLVLKVSCWPNKGFTVCFMSEPVAVSWLQQQFSYLKDQLADKHNRNPTPTPASALGPLGTHLCKRRTRAIFNIYDFCVYDD